MDNIKFSKGGNMKYLVIILLIVLLMPLINCERRYDYCDKEMTSIREKHGNPDELTIYGDNDYKCEEWEYVGSNYYFQVIFEWCIDIDECHIDSSRMIDSVNN